VTLLTTFISARFPVLLTFLNLNPAPNKPSLRPDETVDYDNNNSGTRTQA